MIRSSRSRAKRATLGVLLVSVYTLLTGCNPLAGLGGGCPKKDAGGATGTLSATVNGKAAAPANTWVVQNPSGKQFDEANRGGFKFGAGGAGLQVLDRNALPQGQTTNGYALQQPGATQIVNEAPIIKNIQQNQGTDYLPVTPGSTRDVVINGRTVRLRPDRSGKFWLLPDDSVYFGP